MQTQCHAADQQITLGKIDDTTSSYGVPSMPVDLKCPVNPARCDRVTAVD